MKKTYLSAVLTAAIAFGSTANAATVDVDANGFLTGISGIDLGSTGFYDVTFESNPTTLTSYTNEFAETAAMGLSALLESNTLTVGDTFGANSFDSQTFYTLGEMEVDPFFSFSVQNVYSVVNDLSAGDFDFYFEDFSFGTTAEYADFISAQPYEYAAVWTESVADVSAVPVPAAAFLFAPALLGFMGVRKAAKKSS
jgi:hypothetical protein